MGRVTQTARTFMLQRVYCLPGRHPRPPGLIESEGVTCQMLQQAV